MERFLVDTSRGRVELAHEAIEQPSVLICPGGHCDAFSDVGWDLYRELGFGLVTVSRPGYGQTDVGPLSATEFVAPLSEALAALNVTRLTAVVGVSFGGFQAVEFARSGTPRPRALILASAAPSTLPYPDSALERLVGPLAFSPHIQRLTWSLVGAMVRTGVGLRSMTSGLSKLPSREWWPAWSDDDRARAKALFMGMSSGSGFVNDLRQATAATSSLRRQALASVGLPTLVVASRYDGGVTFAHAKDIAAAIPHARLVDTGAPSHLFWLGPDRGAVRDELAGFLGLAASR